MEDMNMNIGGAGAATFYGVNMSEYGDTGVGSMMALMTEQEPGNESIMSTMTRTIPSSAFSSYSHAGQVEGLLSAAAATMFNQGGHHHHHQKHLVGGHFPPQEQLVMNEQAAVISDSSLSSVKTEVCSNQLDYHRKTSGGGGGRSCCPQPSLMARAPHHHQQQQHHQHHQQEASRMVTSLEVDIDSACSSNPNDSIDALKSKIASHPHYPQLLAAYMDCQKVGAPPEVVTVLDEIIQENQLGRHSGTMDIGVDPELDQFMEAYCQMLIKYHLELTKPFKEARTFLNKMETQLNCLSKGAIRSFPSGYSDSDWAGNLDDRRSITGYAFSIGSGVIVWSNKKQSTIALSSCEAEYQALCAATCETIWLRRLLNNAGEGQKESTSIKTDNQSTIKLAYNPVFQKNTKHIDTQFHFV